MLERIDLGEVGYDDARTRMAGWVKECREGIAGDRLFLLSHPPVITYGSRTSAADLPSELGIRTVEVDRGGFATYHGPGQLVGYLVAHLGRRGPVDIVRWMEQGIIDALGLLGFPALRRETPPGSPSLVGVWTPRLHKVASIGMRIRHGVTSHGFALNIDPDMTAFDRFTVCGLHDVTMTSLRRMAEEHHVPMPSEAEVKDALAASLVL